MCNVEMFTGVGQGTKGGVRLLQLGIDVYQAFNDLWRRVGEELGFFVVQRLGVAVELVCTIAEHANIDRQRFVVVLHELGQVEQHVNDVAGHLRSIESRLERLDKIALVLLVQLRPARDESDIEETVRQGRVDVC